MIEFCYPRGGFKISTCLGPVLPSAKAPAGYRMPLQVHCIGQACAPTSASERAWKPIPMGAEMLSTQEFSNSRRPGQ